jgi:O-antigen/teichoic acid export membrane protein
MLSSSVQQAPKRRDRFFHNVLWAWFGVGINIFSGFLLAPYTLHKLGDEAFGIWTLILAFVEYMYLLDLGFRSATVKYTANYATTGEPDKVNETINTAMLYASVSSALTICATILLTTTITNFEHISPQYRHVFSFLLIVVGVAWALGTLFGLPGAALEGLQRFDITSRIWIITIAVRCLGIAAVLYLGHRLMAMGAVTFVSVCLGYALNVIYLYRVWPHFQWSPRLATYSMFRKMLGYGVHTVVATFGQQSLNQASPVLIAHFLPTAFSGYYQQALKLPLYVVDVVGRVGAISGSQAAEMMARNDIESIPRMGIYVNRYCFLLFTPVTISLIVYGRELMHIWLRNPEFVARSAPLLPILAIGITLASAAQFNSSSILFGLGRHQGYAKSLVAEALLQILGIYLALRWHYGILGVAWVTTSLMVVNRGLVTSWLLCRATHFNLVYYVRSIYLSPFLISIPVLLGALWSKSHWLPGTNPFQVVAGGAMIASLYYGLGYFFCLEPHHRDLPLLWIRKRLGRAPED